MVRFNRFQSPFLGLSLLRKSFNLNGWALFVMLGFQSPFLGLSLLLVYKTTPGGRGAETFNPHSWVFLCFNSKIFLAFSSDSHLSIPILGSFFASLEEPPAKFTQIQIFQSPFLGLSLLLLQSALSVIIAITSLSIPILGSFFASLKIKLARPPVLF